MIGWVQCTRSPCILDDVDARIARLRTPITHRRAIRTANLLERPFVEERRRPKIVPIALGEKTIRKLMFDATIRAAALAEWRGVLAA